MSRKTKGGERAEIAYRVESSRLGMFGIRLLISFLTLLLIAAYAVGFFMTERASKSVYVLVPYIVMGIPVILTVCGAALLWQVKAIIPRPFYGRAVKMPKAAGIAVTVIAAVVLVCDFVIAAFVDKEAHLKDELPFLLMCALCCLLAAAAVAVRGAIKCSEISQVTAPPPPPPEQPAPPEAPFYPSTQDSIDGEFGDSDR